MLVNFTNHPSNKWCKEQRDAAGKYGEVIDIPFPDVDPFIDEKEVFFIALGYLSAICELNPSAVLCQGESTLAFLMVSLLKTANIPVIAACSKRVSSERKFLGNTVKTVHYKFARFRQYG